MAGSDEATSNTNRTRCRTAVLVNGDFRLARNLSDFVQVGSQSQSSVSSSAILVLPQLDLRTIVMDVANSDPLSLHLAFLTLCTMEVFDLRGKTSTAMSTRSMMIGVTYKAAGENGLFTSSTYPCPPILPLLFIMRFFRWASATAFLSLIAVSSAKPPTPNDVVASIHDLTMKSSNLQVTTESLTFINLIFVAPQIAKGFSEIVVSIGTVISVAQSYPGVKFDDAGARLIVAALVDFVHVHQALLSIVIGKHGLIASVPLLFTEPIRQVLVKLEACVDTFALILIKMIPTRPADGMESKMMLDVSIEAAITVYS